MGRACDLMANPQSAQLHFMEALQLIESSSDWDKARMEHYYERCEFALRGALLAGHHYFCCTYILVLQVNLSFVSNKSGH